MYKYFGHTVPNTDEWPEWWSLGSPGGSQKHDMSGAGVEQLLGASAGGGSACHGVIDQEHPLTLERDTRGEGTLNVLLAL